MEKIDKGRGVKSQDAKQQKQCKRKTVMARGVLLPLLWGYNKKDD